ncbi:MAG: hypothetical protein B6229_03100 [Spirochaetaceae bacterium 4572_7]|nr:MAG: hypothetical protein B6229_03100 [Spirochaetaceae bacterium 4572_7]
MRVKGNVESNLDNVEGANIHTEKIAGQEVGISKTESGIEISEPEGLTDDELADWRKRAKSSISALSKAHDQNHKYNELQKENELLKQQLKKGNSNETSSNNKESFLEKLGVKTHSEALDIMDSDPEKYFNAQKEYMLNEAQKGIFNQISRDKLVSQISAEGNDMQEVVAFAKSLGTNVTPTLYQVYKNQTRNQQNQRSILKNISEADESQIRFVNGSRTNYSNKQKGILKSLETIIAEKDARKRLY